MNFDDLYKSLNPAQKEAVDIIDGTVMVIAGPGTGKTQVLGARVANILQQTDTSAENILCLTFTEAATVALRNRLYDFIGSSAHRVNIHTYHGFCNQVIQDNKELFGVQDLEPLSDLERIEVLREIIDDLDPNHIMKRFKGEVYFDLSNLDKLFNIMKMENYSSSEIVEEAETYTQTIQNSEEYRLKRDSKNGNKGDLNATFYAEQKKMEVLKAAALLFDAYQNKLKQRKRYDYNDMILWVLKIFKDHEEVLRVLQEKYHYFLVDEYQDTNGAQNDLLSNLINYWDNPNVFVVGDDDQSIYKFQGANVQNITRLLSYASANTSTWYVSQKTIDRARRSWTPQLERNSSTMLKGLRARFPGLSKNITASNPDVAAKQAERSRSSPIPNPYQEVVSTAQKIKDSSSIGKSNSIKRSCSALPGSLSKSVHLIDYLIGGRTSASR